MFEDSGQIYGANKIHAKLIALTGTLTIPRRASISCYMHEIGINPIIATRFNVKNNKAKEQNLFIITLKILAAR